MSIPARSWITEGEYLAIERAAEGKSEYYAGEMFAMAGTSMSHTRIVTNLVFELMRCFRGGPCEAFSTDLRLRVDATGLYTYPDVMVVCGVPHSIDGEMDTITNPTLIVEVLSPSTENYDRGAKFDQYRRLPSLKEYVLIAQDRPSVETYIRCEERNDWRYQANTELEGTVRFESIGCELELADIYRRVEFPERAPSLRPPGNPSGRSK